MCGKEQQKKETDSNDDGGGGGGEKGGVGSTMLRQVAEMGVLSLPQLPIAYSTMSAERREHPHIGATAFWREGYRIERKRGRPSLMQAKQRNQKVQRSPEKNLTN